MTTNVARKPSPSHLAAGAVVASTAVVLARGRDGAPGWNVAFVAVAFVAFATVLVLEHRRPRLRLRDVVAATAVLLALAIAAEPVSSRDVWSYAMYGRTVAVHQESPYRTPPGAFPDDPFTERVSRAWRDTPSVYGPLFTGVSAAGMAVTGDDVLWTRLFFQTLAALAVAIAMWLVWRETHDHRAVALVGLNPLVVVAVVNGGHNDALVGLGVLGAVVLAARRHPGLAGVVGGLAVLVKIAALLPLAAVAAWAVGRRPGGWRAAAVLVVAAGAVVGVGYAAAGGSDAFQPLAEARLHTTSASPWDEPRSRLTRARVERGELGREAGRDVRDNIATLAGIAVAAGAAAVVLRRAGEPTPAIVAGGAVLSYMLLGAYVLPWYAAWGLFSLALRRRDHLTVVAVAHGALLQLAYVPHTDPDRGTSIAPAVHDALVRVQEALRYDALPVLQIAAVVALLVASRDDIGRAAAAVRQPRSARRDSRSATARSASRTAS